MHCGFQCITSTQYCFVKCIRFIISLLTWPNKRQWWILCSTCKGSMLIHCSATPAVTSGLFIFVDDEQMPMHMVTFSNLDPYKMTIWVIALVTQISLLQWGFMLKIWVVQNITDVGFFLAIFTNVLTVN